MRSANWLVEGRAIMSRLDPLAESGGVTVGEFTLGESGFWVSRFGVLAKDALNVSLILVRESLVTAGAFH